MRPPYNHSSDKLLSWSNVTAVPKGLPSSSARVRYRPFMRRLYQIVGVANIVIVPASMASEMDVGVSARSRIAWRLLPFLFLLYVANYLDRTNISYAALGMKGDLGLTDSVFSTASGILCIGYFAMQVPRGSRWLCLLAGRPAVNLGRATLFVLTDRPKEVGWLRSDERGRLVSRLEEDRQAEAHVAHLAIWQALRHPPVLILTGRLFFPYT